MRDGVIILDKPAGLSSRAAVTRVKRLMPRGTKVGHAGTLDPFATGVLVVLVERATRKCEKLMNFPKRYEATVKLGATTVTDDPESPEQILHSGAPPQFDQIGQTVRSFIGPIQQRPPVYSAIKIAGKRACDRVREGQLDLVLKPRTVQVYSIDILSYEWPLLRLRIDCGRGTYIRALARDLGKALNVGGYLTELRRTRVGEYTIERAVRLVDLNPENLESHIISNF
jgi:tRNA pseudouridine55 synthase